MSGGRAVPGWASGLYLVREAQDSGQAGGRDSGQGGGRSGGRAGGRSGGRSGYASRETQEPHEVYETHATHTTHDIRENDESQGLRESHGARDTCGTREARESHEYDRGLRDRETRAREAEGSEETRSRGGEPGETRSRRGEAGEARSRGGVRDNDAHAGGAFDGSVSAVPAAAGSASAGSGDDGDGDDHGRSHPTGGGFGGGFGDEDDLRRLLQSSVDGLEPSPDALDHLRRAVPARRQRRRHAVVGAAAALLLGGTSIPAMLHVANLADGSPDRPANAANSQRAHQADGGTHGEGTEQAGPRPTDQGGARPGGGQPAGKGKTREKNGTGHGPGAGTPAPDETMDVTSPVCGRDQLGQGTSKVGPADADGRVYGAFRVVNTSAMPCSVQGGGTVVVASAQGSTNPDHIHVVDHTSGDEATGLPDPATTPDQLVLKPGEAYEVKFAWIPQAGGGPTGCANPGPSPTPDPSKDPGQSPDAGATTGTDTGGQAGGDDGGASGGGAASGGIVLSHTPEAGEPAATDAKIADACAGTVYRTEAVAAE
ncbi:hypothetical protein [Streptomyces sp. NRRL S-1448]|uniref:hypothetical protein n=1 Tax=Streptomyces sp. NRRL S-1448 TaxID=1463883 RepID=UPI001F45F014|nr:hypothetical protein [Streptomyces sp. NRRL S-1448]